MVFGVIPPPGCGRPREGDVATSLILRSGKMSAKIIAPGVARDYLRDGRSGRVIHALGAADVEPNAWGPRAGSPRLLADFRQEKPSAGVSNPRTGGGWGCRFLPLWAAVGVLIYGLVV
jgi:hypothetical protein